MDGNPEPQLGLDMGRIASDLREKGLRLTRLKRAVLRQFADGACAFTAEELGMRIGITGDLSPLYRCLASLEDAGVLTHLYLDEGFRRYDLADAYGRHHHHLLCTGCASVERIECGLAEHHVARPAHEQGYVLRDHHLVLRGLCPNCQKIGRRREARDP
ncbi:MAG: transcriptional repressor [Actinobacteria bacterium]|nr:transcriptional repressor [Actinomycetota bacterium]